MMWRLVQKELRLFGADRGAMAALFIMPVVFMGFFGLAFPGQGDPMTQAAGASGFQLAVPGNAVLFGFFIALTCALGFAEERRTGTYHRLLAAPVPRWFIVCAKLVPYMIIGAVQMFVLFAVGIGAFGLKVPGSIGELAAVAGAVVLCAVCLGLLFASLGRTEKQLGGVGSIVLLTMGLIGGAMVPRLVMPKVMQDLGKVVPHGWALDGFYAVLIPGHGGGSGVFESVVALLGFAVVFAVVGVARLRFGPA